MKERETRDSSVFVKERRIWKKFPSQKKKNEVKKDIKKILKRFVEIYRREKNIGKIMMWCEIA